MSSQQQLQTERSKADKSVSVPEQLSTDQRVAQLNDLYEKHIGKGQIIIGISVLATEFGNDIDAARSKNPKKVNSFSAICKHKDLHPDLQGPVLRRWVHAAATKIELDAVGVNTNKLNYSHLRELSKLDDLHDRKETAELIIDENLGYKETVALVKNDSKKEAVESSEEAPIGEVAQKLIAGLDRPHTLSKNDALSSLLLDSARVKAELDYDEQTVIYSKAKGKRAKEVASVARTEKDLQTSKESVEFLDKVLKTFRNQSAKNTPQK